MRYATDRPMMNGTLRLHTSAPSHDAAVEHLQRLVLHHPERCIYLQKVESEEVAPSPWPNGTWYVAVRVTKRDTWSTVASGLSEYQATKFLAALAGRTYEGRPLYATRIGREVE